MRQPSARQADRWTLWTPVAFGIGCAVYFALPREPALWIAWALVPLAASLLVATRWSVWRATTLALVLTACAVGGFATAKLRTEAVKGPVAQSGGRPQPMEAWVLDVASPGQGGQRLLLAFSPVAVRRQSRSVSMFSACTSEISRE